jgi:FeS assembly SUF system protein
MSRPIETPLPGASPDSSPAAATSSDAEERAVETSSGAMPADVAPAAASSPETPVSDSADAPAGGKVDRARLEQLIIDALHTVYDPEIPVDIYELGLIYSVEIADDGKVAITMTLTTPACPVAGSMPGQVEKVVRMVEGVTDVVVDLVWEPTWGPAMMTESARLQLNMY